MEIVVLRGWRRLYVYENSNIMQEYPVAVGRPGLPTPIGNFTIINKQVNPGGPFGERWMGLSMPGYGIHGTNDNSSIGKSISHGCIRMYNPDVITLFDQTGVGTTVRIAENLEDLLAGYERPTGTPHLVKKGETLKKLSRAYGVSVRAISQKNHLENTRDVIYPGQMLIIPTQY